MAAQQATLLVLAGLAASVVFGGVAIGVIRVALRAMNVKQPAAARFVFWFTALIAMLIAVPAFVVSGSVAMHRVPVVAMPIHTVSTSTASRIQHEVAILRGWDDFSRPPRLPKNLQNDIGGPDREIPQWRIAVLVLAGVWLAGAVFAVVRLIFGLLRLASIRKKATLLEVRACARGSVEILNADAFSVPVALGYRRPAIVLPTHVLALDRSSELEHILMHEMEHLHRFDDVTSLFQAVCVALLWFNPFAHYIGRRLTLEREMACDEAVVARTGKRTGYAATLWKIATGESNVLAPNVLTAFFSGSDTVERMDNLLRQGPRVNFRRAPIAIFAALQTIALLGTAVAAPARFAVAGHLEDFTTVSLVNGQSLAIGGRTADGRGLGSAQLYDANGRRIALIPMHVARWAATATRLSDGDILVIGGMTAGGATNASEIYDVKTRTFLPAAPMRVPRAGHTATLLPDGRVLIADGESAPGRYVATTEIYDPRTGHSTFTANGAGRIFPTALLIDKDSVLMFGGRNDYGDLRCAIIYNPSLNGYKDAGRMVFANSRTIVFRLPSGKLITHYIRSA